MDWAEILTVVASAAVTGSFATFWKMSHRLTKIEEDLFRLREKTNLVERRLERDDQRLFTIMKRMKPRP